MNHVPERKLHCAVIDHARCLPTMLLAPLERCTLARERVIR
jgi:hypothetical protein